jgi:osmoprotectant transport system ATP-binding protein
MIRLDQVSCAFQRAGSPPVFAVRDLDLEVQAGETLALVGPSGCGKTTTLRLLNRLVEPTIGRILIDGEDASKVDVIRLRRRMGYVVQRGGLFPHLTVGGNLSLLCELESWPTAQINRRVNELLELVGLPFMKFRERFPAELSGGQRQRVSVARALMLDPEILLMDEPFGALDPITRRRLRREFKDLKRRVTKTIVIVTHDLSVAFYLGDRVAVLNEGRLVQVATPDELRAQPATEWVRTFLDPETMGLDSGELS